MAEGGSIPGEPKSLLVFTEPSAEELLPEAVHCDARAVSGCWGETSHFARSRRV